MAKKKISDEIAFKNLKKSITRGEFEAILSVAKREYKRMKDIEQKAHKFRKKTLSSLDELEGDKRDLQFRATEKMVLGLANQAKKQVGRLFGENIYRLPALTDFINRFEVSGKELPYIDFNFINDEK